ncbi:hypothetical protein LPJ73_006030 [Coemansia sp. RSA 2703]|nr:hypothetical protein LPJ73_006030 [Coemansia sp. RSA 2703]
MVRAYYECCAVRPARPSLAVLAAALRKRRARAFFACLAAAARWAAWAWALPMFALLLAVADLVLCSVLGTRLAARLQHLALDAAICLVCAAVTLLAAATDMTARIRSHLA